MRDQENQDDHPPPPKHAPSSSSHQMQDLSDVGALENSRRLSDGNRPSISSGSDSSISSWLFTGSDALDSWHMSKRQKQKVELKRTLGDITDQIVSENNHSEESGVAVKAPEVHKTAYAEPACMKPGYVPPVSNIRFR